MDPFRFGRACIISPAARERRESIMKTKNLLFVCAAFPALGAAQSFNLIGDIAGGAVHSAAIGVNNFGTAVGHSMSTPNSVGVRWTAGGGLQGLPNYNGGYSGHANAISADGTTIVGNTTQGGPTSKSVVWRNGAAIALTDAPLGDDNAGATSVSADGNVVVGYGSGYNNTVALLWTLANGAEVSRQVLPDLAGGANTAQALDVSADGLTAVGFGSVAGGWQTAAMWKNGQVTSLGTLPGGSQQSIANSISADGQYIVGRAIGSDGTYAFRWSEASGMVSLGDFAGGYTASQANAVSGDGKVVVGTGTLANNKVTPFYWTEETGMLELSAFLQSKGLDLSILGGGGSLYNVYDVSADGRYIVGQAYLANGTYSGFVADLGTQAAPVPEPATLGALGIGALGLIRRKRRAQR